MIFDFWNPYGFHYHLPRYHLIITIIVVEKNTMRWSPIPRKDFDSMKDEQRSLQRQPPGYRSPNVSAHCILVSELPRKTQQSSTGWTKLLFTSRRDRARPAQQWTSVPMHSTWPRQPVKSNGSTGNTHSSAEGPPSLPKESEVLKAESVPEGHCTVLT